MLQAYRDDVVALNKEYEAEFYTDVSRIKQQAALQPDEPPLESSPESENSFVIPPDGVNKRWKKTEDGWECEDDHSSPPAEKVEAEEKAPPPAWAKKLYKKIALVSHPDRTLEDRRKDKLNRIFREAASTMESGDFKSLLGFALELDVDIEDVEVPMIPMLSERINDLKSEIAQIEKTFPWLWGETKGMLEMRVNIIVSYFNQEGILLKKQGLEDIISQLDNDE